MKFNKSAESEKWYVGFDNDQPVGKIITDEYDGKKFVYFEPLRLVILFPDDLDQISEKIKSVCRELGIDTTSTFTSNQDIK